MTEGDDEASRGPRTSPSSTQPPSRTTTPTGRLAARIRSLGITRLTARSIALTYVAAFAAGTAFTLLGLPLPWLLGPLTLALVLGVADKPLPQPAGLVMPMRTMVGVAIGGSFTPDLAAKVGGTLTSLALLIPYTIAITALGYLFLTRLARFDRPTAFFSAAPGGLSDMVMYAQDSGADLRRVTLVQAARVLSIVFTLPFWLQFVGGLPLGGAAPSSFHLWQITALDAVTIVVLAWAGWRLADRLGLAGGSIVGPMVLSAVVHVTGLSTTKVPVELIVLAQVTIGVVIGSQFRGITLYEFVSVLSWGIAFAAMLLVAAGAMALLTARLTGLDPTALLLSYAPGGQNEMAIIGLILGIDVAIIALHHLVRVVMVVIGAQLVHQANPGWRDDRR